ARRHTVISTPDSVRGGWLERRLLRKTRVIYHVVNSIRDSCFRHPEGFVKQKLRADRFGTPAIEPHPAAVAVARSVSYILTLSATTDGVQDAIHHARRCASSWGLTQDRLERH